jgi:ABC-type multidrug transport system fused ATPase/permease subunit
VADDNLPYLPDPSPRPNPLTRALGWIAAHPVYNLLLFAICLAAFIWAVVWAPSHRSIQTVTTFTPGSSLAIRVRQPELTAPGWVFAIGIVSAVLALLFLMLFLDRFINRRPNPNTRSQRVARLTTALDEAVGTIEGIRREVEEGHALLAQLQSDTEVNRQLSDMSKEQSDAVWKTAAEIIRAENRRQMPVNVATQLVVGIVVALVGGILIGHFALG